MVLICSSSYTHTSLKFIGFGFLFNRFWISCQKHRYIYIYLTCIFDSIHIQYVLKLFQYHVFVFTWVLEKTVFHFKIQVFEKYRFWFKAKFQYHKNGSNCLKYVLNFCHTYLYFKDLIRTYFCEIYVYFTEFFRRQNSKFLIPKILEWLSAGRPRQK